MVADTEGVGIYALAEEDAQRVVVGSQDHIEHPRRCVVVEPHLPGRGVGVRDVGQGIEDAVDDGDDLDGLGARRDAGIGSAVVRIEVEHGPDDTLATDGGVVGGVPDLGDVDARGGAVVLLAGYHKALEVDIGRVVSTEAVVTGSNCYGYSGMKTDFQASIALIADGHVDVGKLVTHRFSLDEIGEAFRIAADKSSGSIKVHVCQ